MGAVYAVEHLLLRKKMAVKILHPDLTSVKSLAIRFEREAMATAQIDHPNVAAAVDFGTLADGSMYLALEFLEGRSLRTEISQGPLPVVRALRIARQIASLLAATQPLGIVHRDLKPENVMLVRRGEDADFVKVLDFGIARMTSLPEGEAGAAAALTRVGAVFGTPEYMAPEQALGQRVDVRADLYSLGVMLFEMIAGVRPYSPSPGQPAILAQQITSPRPSFADIAPGMAVPAEVERVVGRLLAKGAEDRYQRASDVVTILEKLTSDVEVASTKGSPPPVQREALPAFELSTKITGLTAIEDVVAAASSRELEPGATVSEQSDETPGVTDGGNGTTAARSQQCPPSAPVPVAPLATPGAQPNSLARAARWLGSGAIALRKRLDARLGPRFSRISPLARLTFCVGLSCGLVVALVVWFVAATRHVDGNHAIASATPGVASASQAAGAPVAPSASAGRAAETTPLAIDNAKDPEALLTLMQTKLSEGRDADATSLASKVLSKHADRRSDARIAETLYRAANSASKEAADTAFALLEGMMAQQGADVLYQLWLDKAVRESTRRRSEKWLHGAQFTKSASSATVLAVRLRLAESCEKKRDLLPLAAKGAGPFALAYLRELDSDKGCGITGKDDCFPCLRKDNRLKDAITQIEARGSK
jgi:eukaryotic-like serine/threonine-protein kinase